ncbi:MAG: hypothetical protein ABFE01_07785 [Phycisphaerales bacterium]|jgi:uncharacterized protein involved in exopolysaccharide biosynthesis
MSRSIIQWIVVAALLCSLAGGCARERRREFAQRAADLKTQVQVLQQRVDSQEKRIERLEGQVAELSKNR